MNDYISREDVQGQIVKAAEKCQIKLFDKSVNVILQILQNMPTADVQPVKQGHWIPQGDDMWLCSNCKENIIFSEHESDRAEKQRYCCKCGARMDGDTNG